MHASYLNYNRCKQHHDKPALHLQINHMVVVSAQDRRNMHSDQRLLALVSGASRMLHSSDKLAYSPSLMRDCELERVMTSSESTCSTSEQEHSIQPAPGQKSLVRELSCCPALSAPFDELRCGVWGVVCSVTASRSGDQCGAVICDLYVTKAVGHTSIWAAHHDQHGVATDQSKKLHHRFV
jgi:hypothetical protein